MNYSGDASTLAKAVTAAGWIVASFGFLLKR